MLSGTFAVNKNSFQTTIGKCCTDEWLCVWVDQLISKIVDVVTVMYGVSSLLYFDFV